MNWRYLWITSLVLAAFYFGAGVLTASRAVTLTPTFIDKSVPLVTWTVWIYAMEYFMLPLAFLALRSAELLRGMMVALVTAVVSSGLIFIIYPTVMNRPKITGDGISEQGFRLLHTIDTPRNCFPSLHVSIMVLIAIYLSRESRLGGVIAWLMALVVIISTLTTKQHYFVDILGGLCVAAFAVWVSALDASRAKSQTKLQK
ncbi:MAG: phosphatase PAP2 family protein [Myxococcota bacterium]